MVCIAPDISFRLAVLKAGGVLNLKADAEQTWTCTIGSGKVNVKIGGGELIVGPNALVKIKAGEAAVFENRLYVDAYLHIRGFHNV